MTRALVRARSPSREPTRRIQSESLALHRRTTHKQANFAAFSRLAAS
jgi:hypothetical protein